MPGGSIDGEELVAVAEEDHLGIRPLDSIRVVIIDRRVVLIDVASCLVGVLVRIIAVVEGGTGAVVESALGLHDIDLSAMGPPLVLVVGLREHPEGRP